ncbi:MAG: glycosyltransferase [Bacteroidetes bacterium]|nr:glycosyltransferase [Bacteroidota bacterium]
MNSVIVIFTSILVTLYLIYFLRLRFLWTKQENYNVVLPNTPITKVSIVIAARNETKNISTCLHDIIQQNYPTDLVEIIVVDDNSNDDTVSIIQQISKAHPKNEVRLIELKDTSKNKSPKKRAIAAAISAATGDLLISTDADCRFPKNWISNIEAFYRERNAKLIVAPISIKQEVKNSFLIDFQYYDMQSLVMSGAASLFAQKALLCSAANMAFNRIAYLQIQHQIKGQSLASGDDMFLLLAFQNQFPNDIHFIKSNEVLVETVPQTSLSDFIHQRLRWAAKGFYYRNSYVQVVAFIVLAINLMLLTTAISSFFYPNSILLFLLLFLTKLFVDYYFMRAAYPFFKEKIKFYKAALIVLMYPILIGAIALFALQGSYNWKGRKLH